MSQLVILDNEAVQALKDPAHRKHRQVVSHVQVVASRKRRAAAIQVVVPTAVRVEAGWDRTSATWAFPNRLRIADVPLDAVQASAAAAIRVQTGVSVADAHVGAVIRSISADKVTVLTSDPADMCVVAGDNDVVIVAI
jgi:predicted nucleic acid-binding protein